ncbi:uroporphyrinogen-III C-methyltransferase [Pseudohongiella sp.]|uniref:uroporphyrinogen-III C-methyltransferase n=1 Tax=marine sediment metagenome TaxID=412755 RepID=A0A0F9Z6C9_9ZZZZ|nr:uroporphyrinogen-III C-methyltransferase [Pseudohongiella sp.]HDZ09494.1 uroporphyrinogen-III C-methyltransferase [Pseudohongiella sp.]HEA63934.1 uroporphyrinogen-III C-methyltransferase [Pseudohongiella sp.]
MLTLIKANQTKLPAGEVWLVGAGPGDPELISVKGLRLIRQADVLIYDRLVSSELLSEAHAGALMIDVGKRPGHHPVPQSQIEALLLLHARAGRSVVRLKGGDPFVFGRGGEEMMSLKAAGVTVHVVPGITAASACAATAGFPLTQRNIASGVCLTTAHYADEQDHTHWQSLVADKSRTLVFYMGLSSLGKIRSALMQHGMPASTPAALIENGSCDDQRSCYCTVADIERVARNHKLKSPCLLVIGDVVALAAQNNNTAQTVDALSA